MVLRSRRPQVHFVLGYSLFALPDTPSAVLGGYAMTAFPRDERPLRELVSDVPAPGGGVVQFSSPLSHRRVGDGWAFWSHGYTGDVYRYAEASVLTLDLPENARAFYFGVSHGMGSQFTVAATADDGTRVEQLVDAVSSRQFGFYVDDDAQRLTRVTLSFPGGTWAIGEFGIAVPEPTTALLLLFGALGHARRRG